MEMKRERVVVTGMSVVTPIGENLERFWYNHIRGMSGVREITDFEIPCNLSAIAGIADCFKPESVGLKQEEIEKYDRSVLFALAATKEAIAMSGLDYSKENNPDKRGVYIANAIGGIGNMEQTFRKGTKSGETSLPLTSNSNDPVYDWFQFNTISRTLAEKYNFSGGNAVITTGCTGGIDALGYALEAIRSGEIDVALTGATEAPITPLPVAAFNKIKATSRKKNDCPERASRPFDKDRDGFVLAEGCGILVVESLTHAKKRGATILAEVFGFGSCNNAQHMTDIPQDGISIANSIELALEDSGIPKEAINFVNMHGSSTPQNDRAENQALFSIFEDRTEQIPVTSVKSQIGHPLAASNSIEIVSSIKSIQEGIIPPTINLVEKDPAIDLWVVGNTKLQYPVEYVLKISSGFSGIHSSLIIGKYSE
ncbi:beta-ketoacyl-[acyl-carrier-protein] synthase family protein [Bacillus sp. MCCB 382]|uniref:beta-ketoacyl-[acyl-carrier-protein] synthase family protein n=1 Tax=Bacillus sp. MCCB 382 TaxID=2860197 RepID=UPI001C599E3E|nr:beta-ketoacyl-[acyl-carrier-protein] synthase family protein [Bacillus sp. MCCB 382]